RPFARRRRRAAHRARPSGARRRSHPDRSCRAWALPALDLQALLHPAHWPRAPAPAATHVEGVPAAIPRWLAARERRALPHHARATRLDVARSRALGARDRLGEPAVVVAARAAHAPAGRGADRVLG